MRNERSMTTAEASARSPEDLQRIIDSVRSRFLTQREFIRDGGAVEFLLNSSENEKTKSKFLSLINELRAHGDSAILRRTEEGIVLIVFRKPVFPKAKLGKPLILLAATIGTILADGFIRAYSSSTPVSQLIGVAVIYAASLIGIIGIHELGHKIASWHHKMDSSWPYFIPGIPGVWPTMGAVISSREPPTNRDSLFDLGLSGPIAGLLVTVIVSIVAVYGAVLEPASAFRNVPLSGLDDYTSFLLSALRNPSQSVVVTGPIFSLLYFAYSIGFLITFVNLLPAWQLDGGHIANSAVSPRVHQILTYVSVVMMIIAQFYLMAILVLFLSSRTPSLRPLDDVSPLSKKRKVFFALTWVLAGAIYFFVILNNAYFGLGTLFH
jgi:membrane-associated protease RseP (regulator of RpoE activity)